MRDDAGFELVCVPAMEQEFRDARLENLINLGLPIGKVIATPRSDLISPKARALNELMPIAFVDDYLPYHRGVSPMIHRALIDRSESGSPNHGEDLRLVDSSHLNLLDFATWWLSPSR